MQISLINGVVNDALYVHKAGTETIPGNKTFTGGISSVPPGTGVGNQAFGTDALRSNTTGGANAAFGTYALQSNTSGLGNVAFGPYTLPQNTVGNGNFGVGSFALGRNINGSYNIGFGSGGLFNCISGGYNIGLGTNSGYTLTTGLYNTLVGHFSDVASASQNYGMALGHKAIAAAYELALSPFTNVLTLYGNSTVQVQPRADLTVSNIDNTDASRKYQITLHAWDLLQREIMSGGTDGTQGLISFLGVPLVAQQTLAAAATNATDVITLANSLRTALINLGLGA